MAKNKLISRPRVAQEISPEGLYCVEVFAYPPAMARPPEIAAALREIKKKLAEVLPKLTEIETIVRPCDV